MFFTICHWILTGILHLLLLLKKIREQVLVPLLLQSVWVAIKIMPVRIIARSDGDWNTLWVKECGTRGMKTCPIVQKKGISFASIVTTYTHSLVYSKIIQGRQYFVVLFAEPIKVDTSLLFILKVPFAQKTLGLISWLIID